MLKDQVIHTVYGLRVKGSDVFFYIGVTSNIIKNRLSVHLSHVKSGKETNKQKIQHIVDANFNVEIIPLKRIKDNKKLAFEEEKYAIEKYLKLGHPLANSIRASSEYFNGEPMAKQFLFRTTETLFDNLYEESHMGGKSVNLLINEAICEKYKVGEVKIKQAKNAPKQA